ncbi:MAG: acyl-CoA/acyl-ACP dehydrogenase [Rhodospirillales bacterium]|nr:acyl-CoA/acyl-ACP dehydrogenase [Rhodospirillales bacterium]QQS13668.1 MAG: acyl-CoA/acyl-ACP dehydrogenase [Rhodospirillales bacterium]
MEFGFNEQQLAIRDSVAKLCTQFDDKYWLKKDKEGGFPHDFYKAMADAGWLGIAMPEEYGGSGLGITEAALLMQTVAASGAALQGASAIHLNIFGPNPIVVFGTEEQKKRILPDIIKGRVKGCFAVTEPDAGLNTTALETKAERAGNGYIVTGKKVWTTTAQIADKMLLIARTTPKEQCRKSTDGLSLFYTDFDRSKIEVREIDKMGRKAIDTNQIFIDGLKVPLEDRIGEEGKGFHYLLHGLNPERVLIAAEAVGIGRAALAKATQYAKERVVFGRPIGKNQAIQHPLAESWAQLEAVDLLTFKAAWLYDNGKECGAEANAAKLLAGRAAWESCERAVLTHGGYGYAKEFHVERFLREVMIARIAPVSEQLVLCYIAERVLGLPKSY